MKTIFTLIFAAMFFNLFSQNNVWNANGNKQSYNKSSADLLFTPSGITIDPPQEALGALAATILPTAVDLTFKIATDLLEARKEQYSGEYQTQNSYLEAGKRTIPDITFIRTISEDGKDATALKIVLKAKKIEDLESFIYYVHSVELLFSKARWKTRHKSLDYTIELIPTLRINGEDKSLNLPPISMTGTPFGHRAFVETNTTLPKYRTSFIPMPSGAMFIHAGIKIIETNPAKVKAEKILATFNNYKDNAITVIKVVLAESQPAPETIKQRDQSTHPEKEKEKTTQENNGQSTATPPPSGN